MKLNFAFEADAVRQRTVPFVSVLRAAQRGVRRMAYQHLGKVIPSLTRINPPGLAAWRVNASQKNC